MNAEQYQPGVCNIGGPEIAKRKQVAYFGGFLFVIYAVAVFVKDFTLIFSIVPALIFSIGFIQSRKKFCLAYGLLGTFNFQNFGTMSKVMDRQALAADRRTALGIILQSIGLALILSSILALLAAI